MKSNINKTGLTLIEMLIVTVIITVLMAMVAGIAKRVETQRDEHLLREAFVNISTAIQHFADYDYRYSTDSNYYNAPNREGKVRFYRALKFPVDCNGCPWDAGVASWNVKTILAEVLGTFPSNILITGGTHVPEYSGSEVLYYFLGQVPECRRILNKIDAEMITNEDENGDPLYIVIDGISQPLFRFIDPWGKI